MMMPAKAIWKPYERVSLLADDDGVAPAFAAFATFLEESDESEFDLELSLSAIGIKAYRLTQGI